MGAVACLFLLFFCQLLLFVLFILFVFSFGLMFSSYYYISFPSYLWFSILAHKMAMEKNLYNRNLSGVRLHDGPDLKLFILVGWDRSFRLLLGPPGLN